MFLAGELVYKLKKPVRFDFLDFSTVALREQACREELRLSLGKMLSESDYAGEVDVIVVDNASTDGTTEMLSRYPSVRVVRTEQNLGFAGGVQVGLLEAPEDIWAKLRPAVTDPARACVDQGAAACANNGRCDGKGGCQRYDEAMPVARRAVILSRSRPEWVVADLATLALGGVTCPIFSAERPDKVVPKTTSSAVNGFFVVLSWGLPSTRKVTL